MKENLREILDAALAAAEPGRTVRRFLSMEDGRVKVGDEIFEPRRVFVLAVGKAAGPMSRAAGEILGEVLSGGLCVIKAEHEEPPEPFETVTASHPEPDEQSVRAAERTEEFLDGLEEGDLLLVLVSGGASALLADAAPGIALEDLKQLTGALLRSGAAIGEINAVRKHVSTLKGGNLVRRAAPARVVTLLLSDVVGDEPSSIGSGLTAPDPTKLEDARRVLERYGIEAPQSVTDHLEKGHETPKPGDAAFEKLTNLIVGGGRLTAEAAAGKARELGYEPLLLSTYVTGEAQGAANLHAAIVKEILESDNPLAPPCAVVSGGEATVVVRGEGTGGPNQEFALALAVELEGVEGWAALAVDTDGNDGPTDAAGGLVTGETAAAIRESGVDPAEALDENDAYHALEAVDALVSTGFTGTNVNDLRVVLVSGETGSAG
ncbi:MAG: D-glycerate 2-kinase [uncultured Rubrobacteraceae bacterium]|uniref:D-glycerate 2-kinase n=1 Tax=uncultured Rubrobacteraceae bacterium TaxID=349277 RepID=A0A6J4PU98_9ACTN|nr:MAG: D-glycerate 2-kinase [uncultured Rubrobacteraceae bacterium]